jgi:hypothetical protein
MVHISYLKSPELIRDPRPGNGYAVVLAANFSRKAETGDSKYPLIGIDQALDDLNVLAFETDAVFEHAANGRTVLHHSMPNPKELYERKLTGGERRRCPRHVVLYDEERDLAIARMVLWVASNFNGGDTPLGHSAVGHLEFGIGSAGFFDALLKPTVEELCSNFVLRRNINYHNNMHYAVLYEKSKPVGANLTDKPALEHLVPGIELPRVYD